MVMQRSLNIKCIQDDEFITNFACASSKNPKHLKYEIPVTEAEQHRLYIKDGDNFWVSCCNGQQRAFRKKLDYTNLLEFLPLSTLIYEVKHVPHEIVVLISSVTFH